MIARCENPNNKQFKDYGGRGISVCKRWRDDYAAFLSDMGRRPDGCTIDRINNDGNYEPGNCKWSTKMQQMANTRRAKMISFNGETAHVSEWARRFGLDYKLVHLRLKRGWSIEKALTTSPSAYHGKGTP